MVFLRKWAAMAAMAAVLALAGCGDDGGGGGGNQRLCSAGSAEGCVCIGGGFGSRSCASDGNSWSSCFCSTVDSGQVCIPNAPADCSCPGGFGTQVCRPDGFGYGACVCPMGDAGSPDVGQPDAGFPDAGQPDAGFPDVPVRNCSGRECGPDGVGGVCGNCTLSGWTCNLGSGRCVPPDMICRPACSGRVCGADPGMYCEGQTCGTCTGNSTCTPAGQCVCTPRCSGRVCGDNGCGGMCGTCPSGSLCNTAGQCQSTCTPACGGRVCGRDPGPGCTGTCGTCPSGYLCNSAGSACNLNPNSNWQILAVSGTVGNPPGGGAWDPDGSAPDPRFCIQFTDAWYCTDAANNTFIPRWVNGPFQAFAASYLLSGIRARYEDEDTAFHDPICLEGPVSFTASQIFHGSEVTFTCGTVGSFTLRLVAAP